MEKRVGHFIDRKLPDVKSLDIYGEDEKEEAGVKSMHLEKLRPAVQELAIMAKESQNPYHPSVCKHSSTLTVAQAVQMASKARPCAFEGHTVQSALSVRLNKNNKMIENI